MHYALRIKLLPLHAENINRYKRNKMFENLSERLERSFKILKGEGKITEINVAETLKDVRRALLDADVNYKVAKTFTDTVKQKALGMNVLTAIKPGQLMVKLVRWFTTNWRNSWEARLLRSISKVVQPSY